MVSPRYVLDDDEATTERQPWRCDKCNNLLARMYLGPGSNVESKCPRCNSYNVILVSKSDEEMHVNHHSTTPFHVRQNT